MGVENRRSKPAPGKKYNLESIFVRGKVMSDDRTRGRPLERRFVSLQEMSGDPVDDFRERRLRTKAGQRIELFHAGHAPHHVFESGLVGLVIRHINNL